MDTYLREELKDGYAEDNRIMPGRLVQRRKDYVFIWDVPGEGKYCMVLPNTEITGIYPMGESLYRIITVSGMELEGVSRLDAFKINSSYGGVPEIRNLRDMEVKLNNLSIYMGDKFRTFVEEIVEERGIGTITDREVVNQEIREFLYREEICESRNSGDIMIISSDLRTEFALAFMPSLNLIALALYGIDPNGYKFRKGIGRWLCVE